MCHIEKEIWIHDEYRYALGNIGRKTLVYIGSNPSIATAEVDDNTYTFLRTWCNTNNYNGLILLNLYPQVLTMEQRENQIFNRGSFFTVAGSLEKKNFEIIDNTIRDVDKKSLDFDVLLAWGDKVLQREFYYAYIIELMNILQKYNVQNLFHIGITSNKQPRAPIPFEKHTSLQPFTQENLRACLDIYSYKMLDK